jgi:hypothetical protein
MKGDENRTNVVINFFPNLKKVRISGTGLIGLVARGRTIVFVVIL